MRKLEIRSVEEVEKEAGGFVPAMSRTLAAIAALDGRVTTTAYLALVEATGALSSLSEDPAMPAAVALRALAAAEGLDAALRRLEDVAAAVEEEVRRQGFEAALPLLRVSGDEAEATAVRIADCLKISVDPSRLGLPVSVRPRPEPVRASGLSRLMSARPPRQPAPDERLLAILAMAQAHGHAELAKVIGRQMAEGTTRLDALRTASSELVPRIEAQISRMAAQREALAPRRELAEILCQVIAANVRQIEQRLAAMIRRIDFQKETFREDVRTFLDDPANGVEMVVREMMFQEDALDRDIWECFANTTHGRGVQLRYGEVQRRYEAQISLLKEELMQFREELIANRSTFMKTLDPHRSLTLAPPTVASIVAEGEAIHPRPFGRNAGMAPRRESWWEAHGPQVFDAGDLLADGVLIIGGLVIVGGALAVFGEMLSLEALIPEAVTLSVGLGAPMLLAAIYKWLASPEKRKARAARRRRSLILARLDGLMADTVSVHDRILDEVVEEFFVTAEQCLSPLVQSTQRTLDVTVLQDRWIDRSIRATRDSLKTLPV